MIGSLYLGAALAFRIRHNKAGGTRTIRSAGGTPVVMAVTMQRFGKHKVPKATRDMGGWIDTTFRMIGKESTP